MHRALVITSLAALAAAPAVAHADPVELHAPVLEDAPRVYIAPGAALGYANRQAIAGPSVEIGARFAHNFVLHGEVFSGSNAFVAVPGSLQMATVGVDLSSCETVERVCLYIGGAAGVERNTRVDGPSGEEMTVTAQGLQGVVRAGVDVGGKRIRIRYGVESAVLFGALDAGLTTSVAFRF